ncbi:MAG: hypothetical protein NT018_07175 [Armatimonadetes bacterium]|nr:hypothetical protein [Armatimonadota bacterium]
METGNMGSITISGSGKASGGVYEDITVSGSGKVTGDVQAQTVRIFGAATFDGSVNASKLDGSGSLAIACDLESMETKCSGSLRVGGNAKCEKLNVSGSVSIKGNVKVGATHISGRAEIGGDLEGEHVRSSGALNVGGLLSADMIEMNLNGRSRVREIGGERITVLTGNSAGNWMLRFGWPSKEGILEVETIEGDYVHLEATTAKVVRGRQLKIGPNCRIKRVEYGESLQIDPKANVNEIIFTGEGTPPAIDHSPLGHSECRPECGGSWQVRFGTQEIRNPVLRVIAAVLGLGIAAVAVVFAVLLTGSVMGLTFGFVLLLLLVLAGGIPLLVLGALVLNILLLPIRIVQKCFGRKSY